MKFRNGPEEIFKFLGYLMISRFLIDPNRFTLDFILAKFVRSIIVNVGLETL